MNGTPLCHAAANRVGGMKARHAVNWAELAPNGTRGVSPPAQARAGRGPAGAAKILLQPRE
jgi:hypothetical protein